MAMGVRDITNLEELLEVQDDDKIIVIQNGEAKLISKANAKFGGGSATVFYGDTTTSSSGPIRLLDINGNPIGAQAAYDAVMSGMVYVYRITQQDTVTIHSLILSPIVEIMKTGETIINVLFESDRHMFYAGENPTH